MRIKRLIQNLNWKVYVLELVIVILGISIAYQLNIVYENGNNNRLEITAIQNLKKEVEINIAEFESLADYREQITRDSRYVLQLLKSDRGISLDSANKYIFKLVRTSTPDLQQEAANFYLNSNYSDSNIELKNELLALKTFFQELLQLSEGYSRRKEDGFKKALWDSVDFSEHRILSLSTINSVRFKNIIWDLSSDEKELSRLFDQAFKKLKEVEQQMDRLLRGSF